MSTGICLKKNPNIFLIGTPSNNLSMAKMNPKNEKLAKKQWSLKRPKLELVGQRPLQYEHIPLFALNLNSNEGNGAANGEKGMGLPKERHHLNKGGPMVK
jgi:hypothetical protein